jgi:uncharacterized protein (DUF983 family)
MNAPDQSPSPYLSGLKLRCPACGKGRLFQSYLKVADACGECGEDLSALEQGDGPAVFATLILGFLVVGLALFVEVKYTPPLWLHAALWIPLILVGTLVLLPPLKGIMMGAHYRHRKGHVERG